MNIGDLGPWQNREISQLASIDEIEQLEKSAEVFAAQTAGEVTRHGGVIDQPNDALAFFSEQWHPKKPQNGLVCMAIVRPSDNTLLLSQTFNHDKSPQPPDCGSRESALSAARIANLLLDNNGMDEQGTALITYMRGLAIDLAAGDTPRLSDTMPNGSLYKDRFIADITRNAVGRMMVSSIYTRDTKLQMGGDYLRVHSHNIVKNPEVQILHDTSVLEILLRKGSLGQTFRYLKTLKGHRMSLTQPNTDKNITDLLDGIPDIVEPTKPHVNTMIDAFVEASHQKDTGHLAA